MHNMFWIKYRTLPELLFSHSQSSSIFFHMLLCCCALTCLYNRVEPKICLSTGYDKQFILDKFWDDLMYAWLMYLGKKIWLSIPFLIQCKIFYYMKFGTVLFIENVAISPLCTENNGHYLVFSVFNTFW